MKTGMSLEQMAAEITRQSKTRRDFKVPTTQLKMKATPANDFVTGVTVSVGSVVTDLAPTEVFHNQIGVFTKIPAPYYDRMLANDPELLAHNVNTWLNRSNDTRMVRTLDGSARAFLSNKYRAIDNHMIAEAILPFIMQRGGDLGLRVESCNITSTRLYIKVVSERITAKVLGETVQSGAIISNSEVGLHSFRVEDFSLVLSCLNGAVRPGSGLRKYHVGRSGAELENAYEVFADDTRKSDDKTLMLQMRDVVKATFDAGRFAKWAEGVTLTAERKITSVEKTIANVIEEYELPEIVGGGILDALAKNYDATQWGLANAVTLYAQDPSLSYDKATDLERLGGEILEMPAEKWTELVAA
jgi:hypothetical protein